MSRIERVKTALSSTVSKLRAEIEESHKNNKIPADYSLGFTNGLIFCEHQINCHPGNPKFYDRTTAIGVLPKPVALKTGNMLGAEEIFENLRDTVILNARNLYEPPGIQPEKLIKLMQAIKKMDSFVEEVIESKEGAGPGKVGTESDEIGEDQGAATLPPSPSDEPSLAQFNGA